MKLKQNEKAIELHEAGKLVGHIIIKRVSVGVYIFVKFIPKPQLKKVKPS